MARSKTFQVHTTKWAAKASAIAAHLRRLNNIQIGSVPHLTRQAVKACLIPIALYGAEIWWPGDTISSWKKGKHNQLKNKCGKQLKQLSSVINQGLRAILPVYKTVPIPILY